MTVERMVEIETNDIHVNDRIRVGKYTATCQNEETIQDVLDTFNEKQRLVLNYIVGKAVEDAKKGKTSESNEEDKKLKHNVFDTYGSD